RPPGTPDAASPPAQATPVAAGGVVILRSGKNARDVITAVRDKLETLKASLPEGVEIVTTYDRSQLIDRAILNAAARRWIRCCARWSAPASPSCAT
ncbi:hypothetical protein FK513_29040, partial [Klebsiella pneumoniae]|uniref:efflux RND transporter permease subunit n=1 Tax=Klebsiella pneumoniae TaxID=573 RepID=UPI00210C3C3F